MGASREMIHREAWYLEADEASFRRLLRDFSDGRIPVPEFRHAVQRLGKETEAVRILLRDYDMGYDDYVSGYLGELADSGAMKEIQSFEKLLEDSLFFRNMDYDDLYLRSMLVASGMDPEYAQRSSAWFFEDDGQGLRHHVGNSRISEWDVEELRDFLSESSAMDLYWMRDSLLLEESGNHWDPRETRILRDYAPVVDAWSEIAQGYGEFPNKDLWLELSGAADDGEAWELLRGVE